MADYINKNKLKDTLRNLYRYESFPIADIEQLFDSIPVMDMELVRHGIWENKSHKMMGESPCCSVCGGFNPIETKFCPNCGAIMDNAIQWQWEEDEIG